jgi:hypothetical protein
MRLCPAPAGGARSDLHVFADLTGTKCDDGQRASTWIEPDPAEPSTIRRQGRPPPGVAGDETTPPALAS